jgi:hypothetical protein
MSRSSRFTAAIALLSLSLTACIGGGQSPSASAAPSVAASVPAASVPGASQPAASQAGESAAPSEEDLGPFSCELPMHVDASVARANITDVRTGTHAGYDRVVFEFDGGLPEATIERASPPFLHDASGKPIDVDGSSFLRVTLRGGTKQMDDGSSSYTGPTEFSTDYPTLVHLVEGGDFEAQSTWYLGLTSEACVRITTLDGDEARLAIDLEQ